MARRQVYYLGRYSHRHRRGVLLCHHFHHSGAAAEAKLKSLTGSDHSGYRASAKMALAGTLMQKGDLMGAAKAFGAGPVAQQTGLRATAHALPTPGAGGSSKLW